MKTNVKIFLITILIQLGMSSFSVADSGQNSKTDTVETIKEFKNLYKSGNYYFGGQPTLEAINWLKSEGVQVIINLRTDKENNDFTNTAFNEENLAKEYGIKYISIPVSYPDSYDPSTLKKFSKTITENEQNKIFIHCASGGRVSYFYMAYLIESKGYSLNEAISFGNKIGFSFLLENLLDKEINMSFKE